MRQILKVKWRLLPLLLAVVVLLSPVFQSMWSHYHVSVAAESAQAKLQTFPRNTETEGIPSRIIIPRLAIDLPVIKQNYNKVSKTWPVSNDSANYASNTVHLNNKKGQTLIYGHNNRRIFGPLLKLEPGDLVYVYTQNNHIFKYAYQNSQDISPTKLSIFDDMAKAPAGLKLITCDGANFEFRHLMSLKFLQAS